MNGNTQKQSLPYWVIRVVRKYKPAMQTNLSRHFENWQADHPGVEPTQDTFQECVSHAYEDLMNEIQSQMQFPPPDPNVTKESIAAFDRGEWQTPQEILNELHGSCS